MDTAPATAPVVHSRLRAICANRDDRLMVFLGAESPWALPRGTGRWLRSLRAMYEDELELLMLLRRPHRSSLRCVASDTQSQPPGALAHDALLRRLARLRLPPMLAIEVATPLPAAWRAAPGGVPPGAWRLLEPATHGENAPGGMLLPWHACTLTARHLREAGTARSVILDARSATQGFAHQTACVAELADALLVHGLSVGGIALDGRLTFPDACGTDESVFRPALTDALDLLANAVLQRRITRTTRRPGSIRQCL